jgi:hypothetical protein
VSAAAKVVVVRALPACDTGEAEFVVAAEAGVGEDVVVARFPAVDFVELGRLVVRALESLVLAFDAERPELPTLGPALLWLDDAESPLGESAWASPVALASDVQTPTVRAPVPSHNESLLCGCCAR